MTNLVINLENFPQLELLMKKENMSALSLFMFLVQNMNGNNEYSASFESIAEKLNSSSYTVLKASKILREHKVILIEKTGVTNRYLISSEIVRKIKILHEERMNKNDNRRSNCNS